MIENRAVDLCHPGAKQAEQEDLEPRCGQQSSELQFHWEILSQNNKEESSRGCLTSASGLHMFMHQETHTPSNTQLL